MSKEPLIAIALAVALLLTVGLELTVVDRGDLHATVYGGELPVFWASLALAAVGTLSGLVWLARRLGLQRPQDPYDGSGDANEGMGEDTHG